MVFLWILLALILISFICWALALYCQRNTPDFFGLSGTHYAHRGLHSQANGLPENSLLAYRFAAENGFGVELDVRLSKDNRLVVMHDENLLRTCGVDRNISDLTSDELDTYRLSGSTEKIPYLEEVVSIFEGKCPMIIELKTQGRNYASLTSQVCDLLQNYPNLKFCIQGFDPRVLIWLRKNKPHIIRGQLSADLTKDPIVLPYYQKFFLKNLLLNFYTRPHFIAYRLEDRNKLSFRLCRLLWKVQEVSWTLQTQEDVDAAVKDNRVVIFEGFMPK